MSSVLLWKEEPVSPLSSEEASLLEDTFYHSCLDVKFETDLLACESKAEVASHILENLESLVDLDDLIKEEEPFLLDEKMLPILDEVEPPRAVAVPVPNVKMEYLKQQESTQYLLNDFESLYGVVEMNNLNNVTLTPPQSPPSELTTLEPILASATYPMTETKTTTLYSVPEKQLPPEDMIYRAVPVVNIPVEYPPVVTPQPDIAHELAVVDELVRTRVEDMQWTHSPSSPDSSSSNSNFGDCSSDDPEWAPDHLNYEETTTPTKNQRKRSKPYSRTSPEDKKSRKKEQNKNAATRYRLKKKAEVEIILSEEKGLMEKNKELSENITDLQREIKYIKGLMRDLFKAKGLIN